jgi:thymidylate synthase (FAD)
MNYPINDPYFRVEVLSKTERPNLLSYLAMHQDYSEGNVADELEKLSQLSEEELGDRLVNKCLKFGHFGILEHPSITLNVIGFPHSVMVQARTHRVGISFDVQSQRYTGERVEKLIKKLPKPPFFSEDIAKIFYIRPIGHYSDRQGNKYYWSCEQSHSQKRKSAEQAFSYVWARNMGVAEEHARDLLPQNIRQDFVVTFNARSLLHFCDLRLPKDAQLEIRTMAQMVFQKFSLWMPEVAEWYEKNRYGKNRLSP